jgi:hypothetical protein
MSSIATRPAIDAATHVAATVDSVFATIEIWRGALESEFALLGSLRVDDVDPLVAAFSVPAVSTATLLTGAGFVATPGAVDDAEWHMAWWLRSPEGSAARRLATVDDPAHELFRDYTGQEWWRIPVATGKRHLTGPYVDYVCTDDYTVTATMPVVVAGRMLGVVGADALVDRLERELLPALRDTAQPATVVNASGRVVTSSDAHRAPGSMLRLDGLPAALREVSSAPVILAGGASVLACGSTSLRLVVEG